MVDMNGALLSCSPKHIIHGLAKLLYKYHYCDSCMARKKCRVARTPKYDPIDATGVSLAQVATIHAELQDSFSSSSRRITGLGFSRGRDAR